MRPTTIDTGEVRFRDHLKTLRSLLPFLWPKGRNDLRLRVFLAGILLLAAKVATVFVPLLLGRAVDALAPEALASGNLGAGQDASVFAAIPLALLLAYGAVRVLARGFTELRDAIFSSVAQNAIRRLSLDTFRHLHSLALRFHLERQTGGLNRALDRGAKSIEFLLQFVTFSVFPTLLEIGLVAGILWALFDWRFSAVTLATVVAYATFTFQLTEWRIRLRRKMNEADNDASTKAIDSLLNYETVKYFGNEVHEVRRYDRALAAYEGAAVRSRTSLSLLNSGQTLIVTLGIVLMMTMAAHGVAVGAMTVGDFVMVNTYLIQMAMPLGFFGTVYREIKQSMVDLEVMFGLLGATPEVSDRPEAVPLAPQGGEVVFDKVSFGYDPRRPILHEVSFRVPPGQTIAIVGPSGAGKSTVSRLLFRFYDVSGGEVRVDGQDLRSVTQDSLRAEIGIVPQDTVLFNDTIFYNIAYGRPEATPEEVREAARLAQIHDFVAGLPDGYETLVGERGLKLSGGEKQRVAIARTLLKNPCIFLFDEATSSLDSRTEREIQDSLQRVSRGRTTLVIAHRLSTVVDADQILVLEAGRIVERGRHEALLAAGGPYAAMWQRQQRSAAQAGGDEAPEAAE